MDLVTIITAVASALGGGLMTYLINPRAAARKPQLENEKLKQEAERLRQENESLRQDRCLKSMDTMQKTIHSLESRNFELSKEVSNAHDDTNKAKADLFECSEALCKYSLCPLREPIKGRGDEYFKAIKETNASLFDNTEFEDFAKAKNYKVTRIKPKSQED